MSTQALKWAQCDVFAEARYEGNPLAVFTDATGLTTAQMQALARETNLSETTFILPGDAEEELRNGVRVRIFTVDEELPFAGHPTLGTASWIRLNMPHFAHADEVKLNLDAGVIPVRFSDVGSDSTRGEMRQRDPEFGATPEAESLAKSCGLAASDVHRTLRPQVTSTGLPFCILPLRSVQALEGMRADQRALTALLAPAGGKFVYAMAQVDDATWRVRMPFNGSDDPATGSAAGCGISYLVQHGAARSGQPLTFHQGSEVHRPSRLDVRASLLAGRVTDVFVAGRTIFVAEGRFTHP